MIEAAQQRRLGLREIQRERRNEARLRDHLLDLGPQQRADDEIGSVELCPKVRVLRPALLRVVDSNRRIRIA